MPRDIDQSTSQEATGPNYIGLVRFLLEPFLENSESLHADCEYLPSTNKVWLRVAFDVEDKGKVFGRGGRNIQAIRTILQTAATKGQQSLHLDVFGSSRSSDRDESSDRGTSAPRSKKGRPRRPEKK